MMYISTYFSPIGKLLLASFGEELIGLWIENQKYYLSNYHEEMVENDSLPVFLETKEWLASYFKGENPAIKNLKLNPDGSPFQKKVFRILMDIPYGSVTTYKEIALRISNEMGISSMSSQAVGGAVSHNPISIIIPCHRVIGTNGSLTGYAGGMAKKKFLLSLEKKGIKKDEIG